MKSTVEDPREVETPATDEAAEKAFLESNEHVPEKIEQDQRNEFAEVQPPAPAAPQQGWTAEDVAHIFAGFFMILSFPLTRPLTGFGGDHWSVPDEQCMKLGRAWLPIFQKHIPYDRKPGMIADLFMWLPAIGAVKTVCGPPLKMEIHLYREKKKAAMLRLQQMRASAEARQRSTMAPSSTASTEMAISQA